MNRQILAACVAIAMVSGASRPVQAAPGDTWIINYSTTGAGFQTVVGGGYQGSNYVWATGTDGVRQVRWTFDDFNVVSIGSPSIPDEPRLYKIEQWVPSVFPVGVTEWEWLQIEIAFTPGSTGEGGSHNPDIPWFGTSGMNHQWIGMGLDGPAGEFMEAGPGPHVPENETCMAGPNGEFAYLQRGSTLYTPWSLNSPPNTNTHAGTVLRITDVGAPEPEGCDFTPDIPGAIDLSNVGNADPLYGVVFGISEAPFYNTVYRMVRHGDSTLGAEGWYVHHPPLPLTPGLPADGAYTAHLTPGDPDGDVSFALNFNTNGVIKWRSDNSWPGAPLGSTAIHTLNATVGQEFEVKPYQMLYLLSVKSGNNGQLNVELTYDDDTTENTSAKLYDWFGQDGDAGSLAVGVGGMLRSEDLGVSGFKRINTDGQAAGGGGDHGGAFLFVHPIALNTSKALRQVALAVGADPVSNSLNGSICILAATLTGGAMCDRPELRFDADGDGDVDQDDFGDFQRCLTGTTDPEGAFDAMNCSCADADGDGDVDELDLGYFVDCISGPDVLADPACDDAVAPRECFGLCRLNFDCDKAGRAIRSARRFYEPCSSLPKIAVESAMTCAGSS